ncbi:tripartite tricarboxylate transporter substrate-binding protein [Roseomonas sp. NAR14]|uniref:Tripartite tricarboxylate transporter substrate-binding protein n=1 Tax=Roseomonas acroporae TaxID=2937791 RepID=A0A9X2BWP6_9PROT|nr:tripartite tricarboxylate transporter substrate-binding protein [Roseomonas acroporae]MCK8786296.1 tripartite tricarboxylate transporter substrate-binding protein [Roseomonas acroporae]
MTRCDAPAASLRKPDSMRPAPGRRALARAAAGLATAACLGATLSRPAAAQAPWPNRPIRWIVGFAPGGVGDLTARLVATKLAAALGQPVVVENRPSAGAIVAAEAVAHAPPDGHTIHLTTQTDAIAPALYRRLPYDIMKDFEFVSAMTYFDIVLATAADSPYRTLGDVLAAARARPGAINLGSIAAGNAQNLAAEMLRSMTRTDMTVVTYRSTPDLLNATATGDVQIACEILAPALSQITGGRLRGLAVAATRRFPGLPDLPTTAEAGVPDFVVKSWNGISVPAGTPRPIVERLNAELAKVLRLADVRNRFLELGVLPADPAPPEAFRAFVAEEGRRWGAAAAEANIPRQ